MEDYYATGAGGNGEGWSHQYQPMPIVDQSAIHAQMIAQQQIQMAQQDYVNRLAEEKNSRILKIEYEIQTLRADNIFLKHEVTMLLDKCKKGGELLKSRKKARHKMKMPRFFRFLFYIVIIVFVAKIVWSTNVISIANYFFPPHSQQVQVIHDKCPVVTKK